MFTKLIVRVFMFGCLAFLGLFAVGIAVIHLYEPIPAQGFTYSAEGKTIQLADGRTLACTEVGDPNGSPGFYFHGAPGSRLEGLLYAEANREFGIRMIIPDRPGYGLSNNHENRTYLDWAQDVAELAHYLGVKRFAVLGYSSGRPYAAAVAHQIPERVTVMVIVAGEGPYASDDYPPDVFDSTTFNGSDVNKWMIWSANRAPWQMRTLFGASRILLLRDPGGMLQSEDGFDFEMPEKDIRFFPHDFGQEFIAVQIEGFRPGVEGVVRDFTIERLPWPFALEEIRTYSVLVFHGAGDTSVDPAIADYVCGRIPTCAAPVIFLGEGHSVVYYRYAEIVHAMLAAW
jgi:pimeloyl-ACP methyl ester carboxylesterase